MSVKATQIAAAHGQCADDIVYDVLECPLHREVIAPLGVLKSCARAEGFDLRLASGYRSFERQLSIWNRKARGELPVLDDEENVCDLTGMDLKSRIFSILRWSALPGASRHHWGSDFDIYDAASVGPDYRLQLTLRETAVGGPFHRFYLWLDRELERPGQIFYRPYLHDLGGVAREPWHISCRPLADRYRTCVSVDSLFHLLSGVQIECRETILANLDEIYERFVLNHG